MGEGVNKAERVYGFRPETSTPKGVKLEARSWKPED